MSKVSVFLIFGWCVSSALICGCVTQVNSEKRQSDSEPAQISESRVVTNELISDVGPYFTRISYICDSSKVEPTYKGVPIGRWIKVNTALNHAGLPLSELLTLKQVSFDAEWGTVKYELPISFDVATTNILGGGVDLGWLNNDGDFIECNFEGCERASNGNCLLWWSINWDSPGRHDLRARFTYYNDFDSITVIGPTTVFYSSNVCQFVEGGTFFTSEGTQLYAKLKSASAEFRVELTGVDGKPLKTITDATTTGYITNEWDLVDERGQKFVGNEFVATFHVKYGGEPSQPPAKVTFTRIADPILNEPKN